ncbi:MAG: plsX [Bacteroidetes bacterium]|nr:plsX [Bacteroidota bacterium]
MRIGLDAMGGDFAPKAAIIGAILAQKELPSEDRIVLFGHKDIILEHLLENGGNPELFEIVHAEDVIDMNEKPVKALLKKPNSSLAVGFAYLKDGKIDSFASAGSTGAMLVGTMQSVGTIEGVLRPCLAAVLPKDKEGVSVLVDVGVNPDSKPEVIYQFGLLGSVYSQNALGIDNPKVGLLSNGEEEEKGNAQVQNAHQLMKATNDFNFVGNVEPIELFKNNVDVIVCDGFIGNIILKQTEAFARTVAKRGFVDDFIQRFNYEIYGGLPLLGANGTVIIGHGISNEKAIKNMLLQSKNIFVSKINEMIEATLLNNN